MFRALLFLSMYSYGLIYARVLVYGPMDVTSPQDYL